MGTCMKQLLTSSDPMQRNTSHEMHLNFVFRLQEDHLQRCRRSFILPSSPCRNEAVKWHRYGHIYSTKALPAHPSLGQGNDCQQIVGYHSSNSPNDDSRWICPCCPFPASKPHHHPHQINRSPQQSIHVMPYRLIRVQQMRRIILIHHRPSIL